MFSLWLPRKCSLSGLHQDFWIIFGKSHIFQWGLVIVLDSQLVTNLSGKDSLDIVDISCHAKPTRSMDSMDYHNLVAETIVNVSSDPLSFLTFTLCNHSIKFNHDIRYKSLLCLAMQNTGCTLPQTKSHCSSQGGRCHVQIQPRARKTSALRQAAASCKDRQRLTCIHWLN